MARLSPLVTSDGLRLAVAAGGDDATVRRSQRRLFRRRPGRRLAAASGAGLRPAESRRLRSGGRPRRGSARGRAQRRGRPRDGAPPPRPRSHRPGRPFVRRGRGRALCDRAPGARPPPGAAVAGPAGSGGGVRCRRPTRPATRVFARLAALQQAPPAGDAEARCRAFWAVLQDLYVADPALAPRVADWGRCALPNERAFMGYWTAHVEPSLRRAAPSRRRPRPRHGPVLIVHGTADRSAPYGRRTAPGPDGCPTRGC